MLIGITSAIVAGFTQQSGLGGDAARISIPTRPPTFNKANADKDYIKYILIDKSKSYVFIDLVA